MCLITTPFDAYGIHLEPLTREHLELVRYWRNHPDVARHMLDQNHVDKASHQAWFDRLRQQQDQLCILAYFRDQPVAVANLKALDGAPLENHAGPESGLYLGPGELRRSMLAFLPALAFHELVFGPLGCASLEAIVLNENQAARRFNQILGYVGGDRPGRVPGCTAMTLTRAAHEQARVRFDRFRQDPR